MTADNLSLAGKVAIISGSGRENGIGAAIAIALSRNGAAVTINHVSESSASRAEGVADTIRKTGGKVIVVRADVTVPEGAKKLVDETLKAFGTDQIDVIVNNAGYAMFQATLEASMDDINKMFSVNVNGPIFLTQAAVPYMSNGGRIVNISSVASKLGLKYAAVYSASKAALDSLTYSWAAEFGKSKGITVNSVAPGPVATDMGPAREMVGDVGKMVEETTGVLMGLTRGGDRIGTVEDIADTVLLLASEKGRWITGQFVSASGGITGN